MLMQLIKGERIEGVAYSVNEDLYDTFNEFLRVNHLTPISLRQGKEEGIHAKVYIVEGNPRICYIGSANFTEGGLISYIEALVELRSEYISSKLKEYLCLKETLGRKKVAKELLEENIIIMDSELPEFSSSLEDRVLELMKSERVVIISPYIHKEVLEKYIGVLGRNFSELMIFTGLFNSRIEKVTYDSLKYLEEIWPSLRGLKLKVYLIKDLHMKGVISDKGALIGSSNFTCPGLGIINNKRRIEVDILLNRDDGEKLWSTMYNVLLKYKEEEIESPEKLKEVLEKLKERMDMNTPKEAPDEEVVEPPKYSVKISIEIESEVIVEKEFSGSEGNVEDLSREIAEYIKGEIRKIQKLVKDEVRIRLNSQHKNFIRKLKDNLIKELIKEVPSIS